MNRGRSTTPGLSGLGSRTASGASFRESAVALPVDEFLTTVQLRFSATHAKPTTPETEWVPAHLPLVARDVIRKGAERAAGCGAATPRSAAEVMRAFFELADTDRSGYAAARADAPRRRRAA
eukprot:gene6704-9958_t